MLSLCWVKHFKWNNFAPYMVVTYSCVNWICYSFRHSIKSTDPYKFIAQHERVYWKTFEMKLTTDEDKMIWMWIQGILRFSYNVIVIWWIFRPITTMSIFCCYANGYAYATSNPFYLDIIIRYSKSLYGKFMNIARHYRTKRFVSVKTKEQTHKMSLRLKRELQISRVFHHKQKSHE